MISPGPTGTATYCYLSEQGVCDVFPAVSMRTPTPTRFQEKKSSISFLNFGVMFSSGSECFLGYHGDRNAKPETK